MRRPSSSPRLEYTIDPLTRADLDDLLDIEGQSFETPWTRRMFEAELRHPAATLLGARLSDPERRLVGFLIYRLLFDEMHIFNIAVACDCRNTGVASALLKQGLDRARARGIRYATLEVANANLAAQRLYRRFGFTVGGRRRNYYGDGRDALLLWLDMIPETPSGDGETS